MDIKYFNLATLFGSTIYVLYVAFGWITLVRSGATGVAGEKAIILMFVGYTSLFILFLIVIWISYFILRKK